MKTPKNTIFKDIETMKNIILYYAERYTRRCYKKMKKRLGVMVLSFAIFTGLCLSCSAESSKGKKKIKEKSAIELAKQMGAGWILGNTLDATGNGDSVNSEISWGQPKTTKAMIDGIAAAGYKTIRIPVSWANHMDDYTYEISPDWMKRVKQIVDWAIEDGLYVIINSHHDCWTSPDPMDDCSGYYPNSTNYEESSYFLTEVWTQVGNVFNDEYDEHLIFETMNEPRLRGTSNEWYFDPNKKLCRDAAETLNKLNQDALDAIRATGGNNKKRFVGIPPLQASPDSALAVAFKMPKDIEEGRLFLSVHSYSPYRFAMESPGVTKYTPEMKAENEYMFRTLHKRFIEKGYGVYIGEYGAVNKNNLEDRLAWFTDYITDAKKYGIPCILWDNGYWEVKGTDYNEHFGFYDRKNQKWFFPEIQEAIIKAAE